jgi:hypothetical protein
MRKIELKVNYTAASGLRQSATLNRSWPEYQTLGDVMAELSNTMQAFGAREITVTNVVRK